MDIRQIECLRYVGRRANVSSMLALRRIRHGKFTRGGIKPAANGRLGGRT
jgi:hypothetical protein